MNKEEKPQHFPDDSEDLVETPLFVRPKEWWRAKKESLDLWGFEKYLGCDNTAFKSALSGYKNLLQEIEHEYKETTKSINISPEELEEAKKNRDQMLLDAKRDFVYRMPENYRIWFKKKKIFRSWRFAPESWGFEESRYWGSRSGMTMRERRVLLGVFVLGGLALGFWLYKIFTFEYENPLEKSSPAVFNIERDTTHNVDSLARARILEEQRAEEQKRQKKFIAERNNRIINDVNSGFYITNSDNMRAEVKLLMEIYYENVNKKTLYGISNEALYTSLELISRNNPTVVTKKGNYGIPLQWKPNTKIKLTWAEITAGLDVQTNIKP
ncbi:hypothetical protein F9K33_06820 [bacterium]|nr:MAG: hypothetical protein F9K33_06820 [bacterium]